MEKLFGIPIESVMSGLLIIFALGLAVAAISALRNPVLFKAAVRNIPRRRTQSTLIIIGLMLATVLFSAALITGDTLAHTYRVFGTKQLGEVDLQIVSRMDDNTGELSFFSEAVFQDIEAAVSEVDGFAGVAPLIQSSAAVVFAPETDLSEPRVDLLGIDAQYMTAFDLPIDSESKLLDTELLDSSNVFISQALADRLQVESGDEVQLFLALEPTELSVAGIYEDGPRPAGELAMTLSLPVLQTLTGQEGNINSIIITNEGDAISGVKHTDAVLAALTPVLDGSELTANAVKQEALDFADDFGSGFASIFLLFGYFTFAAGILLIFLIFVMLAAERKQELGIGRALGMQRTHIIRAFSFEGAIYALLAAALGSLLGIFVGWLMVRSLAYGVSTEDGFEISFFFTWQSLVIAYVLGMVATFTVVLFSSWRVSRLNIVRAIRDIPEPKVSRKSLKGWIFTLLLPVFGVIMIMAARSNDVMALYDLGMSLLIIGVPLVAWRLGAPQRAMYTLAGLGLLYWWLSLPLPAFVESWSADITSSVGPEMFFLSSIMLVLGAVWVVIYNADLLTALLVRLLGRVPGLATVLKTAMAYSTYNRFRTGMVLAMFSVVVYALVMMAFIMGGFAKNLTNVPVRSSGFDILAETGYANPITDMEAALLAEASIELDDVQATGSFNGLPIKIAQDGQPEPENKPVDFFISGADSGYLENVTYGFTGLAQGYESANDVWQAIDAGEDVVVVGAGLVKQRNAYGPQFAGPFQLEGFYLEDEVIPETFVTIANPFTGQERRLLVIGVLDSMARYSGGQLLTSQEVVNGLAGMTLPATTFLIQLQEGENVTAIAESVEKAFVVNGMQTTVISDQIHQEAGSQIAIFNLFQAYMTLGIVIGVAALGVIAARSVVERRHQIGVLRAIGFQRPMVQFSFMLESSFVAILGIVLGILLGIRTAKPVIEGFSAFMPGMEYDVPVTNITMFALVTFVAAILITWLTSRQAAEVPPADALRYVE